MALPIITPSQPNSFNLGSSSKQETPPEAINLKGDVDFKSFDIIQMTDLEAFHL